MEHKKKFLIIGNLNALTYKEIFPLIKSNKIWLGQSIHSGDREFRVPDYYQIRTKNCRVDEKGVKYIRVPGIRWFTNMDVPIRHKNLTLYKKYVPEEYPKYDNYDAINVNYTSDIPYDYEGAMGVPITFIDKYNPEQFEILDAIGRYSMLTGPTKETKGKYLTNVNGKPKYARVIVKKVGDSQ